MPCGMKPSQRRAMYAKLRKGAYVKSKTTGAIGKVVGYTGNTGMKVEVDWVTQNKNRSGVPTTYQYQSDLLKIKRRPQKSDLVFVKKFGGDNLTPYEKRARIGVRRYWGDAP